MEYPNEFSQDSRARVDAAQVRAETDFVEAEQRLGSSPSPLNYQSAVENMTKLYINSVFFAFANEAIRVAKEGIWPVCRIQPDVEQFGASLILNAESSKLYYTNGWAFPRANALHFRTEVWEGIKSSERWLAFLDQLTEIAEARVATASPNSSIAGQTSDDFEPEPTEKFHGLFTVAALGVPILELIEPLSNMYLGETVEPVPTWIEASEGPHTGLIAAFTNMSGATDRDSTCALGVIARVVYRCTHDKLLTVGSCCWFGRPEQRIDFKPGETHRLVLAVVTGADERVFALENRRGAILTRGSYDEGIMPLPLGELPLRAELVLIDDKGRPVFEAEFLVEKDKDRIIAARKVKSGQQNDNAAMNSIQTSQSTTVDSNESERILDQRAEKWGDIEIRFTSDERIQIAVAGKSESPTYNYAEFGLSDRRKGTPNSAWITLRHLAEVGGTLKKSPSGERWAATEKRIQALRAHLRKYFGLLDDPLIFINGTGYQAQFKITCLPSYRT